MSMMNKNNMKANEKTSAAVGRKCGRKCIMRERIYAGDRCVTGECDGSVVY